MRFQSVTAGFFVTGGSFQARLTFFVFFTGCAAADCSGAGAFFTALLGAAAALIDASTRPARVSQLTMIDAVPLNISKQEVPARLASYL